MAKSTKRVSAAQAIVDRIMSEPVPDKGQLKHPLKKDEGGKQMTLSEAVAERTTFPTDFDRWSLRMLVDYFGFKFNAETGGSYKKTYGSDCSSFQLICKYFTDNGLQRYQWSKELVDWAFKHRERIVKDHKYLTIQTLPKLLNTYYQEEILPLVEVAQVERTHEPDEPYLDELQESEVTDTKTELFAQYGIPAVLTYFVNKRGANEELIVTKLKEVVHDSLTTNDGKVLLERMFINSIVGSPYPKDFRGLNWRELLAGSTDAFERQKWWRDIDFNGTPLPKYQALL